MIDLNFKSGSQESFDSAWKNREEAFYIHWGKGHPTNQIQLAFQNHYQLFSAIHSNFLPSDQVRVLEVGCGRGSLSAHYAADGYNCTLLDSSESIIQTAQKIFAANSLNASFYHGDAEKLPFDDCTFDIVTSIGLLEHFDNPTTVISEKLRVTQKGGWVINYIVPQKSAAVQKWASVPNYFLALFRGVKTKSGSKDPVYRTQNSISDYLAFSSGLNYSDVFASGTYTYPMISASVDFPFTLNTPLLEYLLVRVFKLYLSIRKTLTRKSPWLCRESFGHAIIIAFQK
mgnify:CR=1 FL=1